MELIEQGSLIEHGGVIEHGRAIDLGEQRWGEIELAEAGYRPAWLRPAAQAMLIAVLTISAVTAAARGAPVPLREALWMLPPGVETVSLGPNVVVAVTEDATTGYNPSTGEQLWQLPIGGAGVQVADAGFGVVQLLTESGPFLEAVLVKDRSGEVLYGSDAPLQFPIGRSPTGNQLVLARQAFTECRPDFCAALTGIDLHNGAIKWEYVADDDELLTWSTVENKITAIISLAADGEVLLVDPATGSTTPWMTVDDAPTGIAVASQHLVLANLTGNSRAAITGYHIPTRSLAWRTTLTLAPHGAGWIGLSDCGGDLCVSTDSAIEVLDATTGAILTTLDRQAMRWLGGPAVIALDLSQPAAARIVIRDRAGALTAEVDRARLIAWANSGDRALLLRDGTAGSGLLLVDAAGRLHHLGTFPDRQVACQAQRDLIACEDGDKRWRIWSLPA